MPISDNGRASGILWRLSLESKSQLHAKSTPRLLCLHWTWGQCPLLASSTSMAVSRETKRSPCSIHVAVKKVFTCCGKAWLWPTTMRCPYAITGSEYSICLYHSDAMPWKRCTHYWPFVRGIHLARWIPLTKGPVMWNFDVSFVDSLNWLVIEMPWLSCEVTVMRTGFPNKW